jgi:mono/diheme cytochrome c family protein
MTRSTKAVVLAAWVFFGCTVFMGYTPHGSAASESSPSTTSGPADLYAASCSACHGSDGRAKTAKGKRLGATDFTGSDWNTNEARGIRIITNGKSEMPSFKKKLTPEQIRSVFGYVLGFRR